MRAVSADGTHLVSLDTGAMNLAGFALPASVVAQVFPDLHDDPDTDSTYDDEEGDDL